MVVVASEHAPEQCRAAAAKKDYGNNLVIRLDRKGKVWESFYSSSAMEDGPFDAHGFVKLAPQIPSKVHPDYPNAIFCCDLGRVGFAKDYPEAATKTECSVIS